MKKHPRILTLLWIALLAGLVLLGCQVQPTATPIPSWPTATPGATAELTSPTPTLPPAEARREIIIIHTNDEHGFLLPTEDADLYYGGAAYAMASWLKKGYDPRKTGSNVLLVSAGDNWTGPAISTWFRGESTTEVMNAMGYRLSVIGNHEFDFGQEVLKKRIKEASFPYLAANLYREGTEELVDFVRPYIIIPINGVKVGIIGLALKETPLVTAQKNLKGLTFGDYEPALRKWVPIMRKEGAQIIIVEGHICAQDLLVLAGRVQDLGITLFEGGHCHQSRTTSFKDMLIDSGSCYWKDYVITKLVYDLNKGQVVEKHQELVDVLTPKGAKVPLDPTVAALLKKWQARTETVLGEEIGYTATGLAQESEALHHLLVDSWLWAYPQADIAISNLGGFRQSLDKGPITLGDIVSVLPFENELYELEVTGKEISHTLSTVGSAIVVGGLVHDAQGNLIVSKRQAPLQEKETYHLLITDYLYNNRKYPFRLYDKDPYPTSISWRQPVIDWIRAQHSSPEHPLEEIIAVKFGVR